MEYTDNKIKPSISDMPNTSKPISKVDLISRKIKAKWLLKGENQIERSLESFKKLKLKR